MKGLRVELARKLKHGIVAHRHGTKGHDMAGGKVFPVVAVGLCGLHGAPA
jgi:hypothetical protein